jgi:hypothetical protein
MNKLNLPPYPFRIRTSGQSKEIFDSLRKKFVLLTPEEWVRQHFIKYLQDELHYPAGLISIERGLIVNQRAKRSDIVIYDQMGKPWMIVECKAPHITLNEAAFYQAANYHLKLNVQFLVVTNGIQHYCCKFVDGTFNFVKGFPAYNV